MPSKPTNTVPFPPARTRVARRALRLRAQHIAAFVLLVLALVLCGAFLASGHTSSAHASASRYGPDPGKVSAAVQAAAWPQQQHIWCGVAAVAAVADFRGAGVSQSAIAGALNSSATQSAWGTPAPSGDSWGPGFEADIARDGGMDPRSHAIALEHATGAGYHEAVDYTGSWTATVHLVADLLRAQEPIAVIVEHGAHTVVVAGVYASGDPSNLNDVTALDVWDPGVGSPDGGAQSAQEMQVSLNTWLYNGQYWGRTYNANWLGGRMLDPDPGVGPYAYDPNSGRDQHLWIGHYVYIRPDAGGQATSGVSPDWAFNQNVALIRGYNGEVPAGYTGPSVPLYTPPPPTPTPRPKPTATPTATATPVYEATPRGQPAKPTLPANDASAVLAPTPTVTARPTPASGSPVSFSLQQVCFGSACAPGAAWTLGGGILLEVVLVALTGALLLSRRRKKGIPAIATAELDLPAAEQAAVGVAADDARAAQISGDADEPVVVATAPVALMDDGAAGGGVAGDVGTELIGPPSAGDDEHAFGPPAQLAESTSRLEGLAGSAPQERDHELGEEQRQEHSAPAALGEDAAAMDDQAVDDQAVDDQALAALAAELAAPAQPDAETQQQSQPPHPVMEPDATAEPAMVRAVPPPSE